MEKKLFFEKQFLDENGREFRLAYWLITRSAKRERTYGVKKKKTGAAGICEYDAFCGLSQEREDVEEFLRRLCKGAALPTELAALCDDFISAQECAEQGDRLAVS